MANENKSKVIENSLFPFRRMLSSIPTETLAKFNTIISAFEYEKEGTEVDFFYELGRGLGLYLLQEVPNDPYLTNKSVEKYFPNLLRQLSQSTSYFGGFGDTLASLENQRIVNGRWPDVSVPIANRLGLILQGLGEALYDLTSGEGGHFHNLIRYVTDYGKPGPWGMEFRKAFNDVYQDVIAQQQLLHYLDQKDVAQLAGRYLL